MMKPSAAAFYQDIKALIPQSKGENPERLAKKKVTGRGGFRPITKSFENRNASFSSNQGSVNNGLLPK